MDDLFHRLSLSEQPQPVVVGGPKATLRDFERRLKEIGYVFIKFTETRGGTDLGVRVDQKATDLSQANFQDCTGTVHVEGTLTLNYIPARCIAQIDLATLSGTGYLAVSNTVHS